MCKMSFLATEFNIFFDIKKINPLHLQVWTLWNVVEFSTLTNLITWKSHLCCVLPRPPGGAPGWTLVFTLDMLDRRAQLALGTLPPVVITGWLQGLELGQQHSMGLCFPWVPGQEVKDFLSTLGETLTASIRGEWSSFCLKTLSQEAWPRRCKPSSQGWDWSAPTTPKSWTGITRRTAGGTGTLTY